MTRGLFITLEGIEGVGKSTQLEYVRSRLVAAGVQNIVVTREPGGTPVAEAIRRVLLAHHEEPVAPHTELLLLFAGRAQHIEQLIKPALDAGNCVLCDRFVDATYAYQGEGRSVPQDFIATLEKWVCQGVTPDLTILLDAPVTQALERIKHRAQSDRIEAEPAAFFNRIRENYLARARLYPERFRVIDASQSVKAVQAQIDQVLQPLLKKVGLA